MQKSDTKVLVVDDEELIRNLFKNSLQKWNYKVDLAHDGQMALQKCSENDYHIVITDLNMPNMNGMSLLERIKSRWPMIEVIVITGYATIESAIEAMKIGAHDFILKPTDFEYVQFTVSKCYQKIKAQLENEELRELNAQLRELNEMKDKFISITNHEIRTPLTIIKGYLEILETSIDSSAQELTEIIDIMKRTTLELTNTANRMHILSHARRNNWSSVYKQIELTSLVKNIYRDMRRLFEHRAIDFQIDLPSTATYVNGVPLALKMVIIELLHNALKFTPDRGEVTLSVSQHRKRVFIEVSDTGIGIPYEKQELVFANFYEIQDTVNHKSSREEFMGGGMGIGLSLVKEILTNLNGKIVLISDPGNGTTFKVSLPNPVKFKEESELADLHPYKC